MKLLAFLLFVFTMSCGSSPKKDKIIPDRDLLREKVTLYESLMIDHVDENGFMNVDKCDSLMNTALGNDKANLFVAEQEPGKWYRRPYYYPDCYSTGSSRSDISRDMLLGVMYRCVKTDDLQCLKRIWDYGTAHTWSMGEHGSEHSVFSPDHIALLAQAIYKVSNGNNNYTARIFKFPTLIPQSGYKAQLQAIFMIMREMVYGDDFLDDNLTTRLAKENVDNPLMQYVGQNYDQAVSLLLNKWPNGRLPTSSDWCAEWLLSEAPNGASVPPCPEERKTHSGGDFLFVAKLLLD